MLRGGGKASCSIASRTTSRTGAASSRWASVFPSETLPRDDGHPLFVPKGPVRCPKGPGRQSEAASSCGSSCKGRGLLSLASKTPSRAKGTARGSEALPSRGSKRGASALSLPSSTPKRGKLDDHSLPASTAFSRTKGRCGDASLPKGAFGGRSGSSRAASQGQKRKAELSLPSSIPVSSRGHLQAPSRTETLAPKSGVFPFLIPCLFLMVRSVELRTRFSLSLEGRSVKLNSRSLARRPRGPAKLRRDLMKQVPLERACSTGLQAPQGRQHRGPYCNYGAKWGTTISCHSP